MVSSLVHLEFLSTRRSRPAVPGRDQLNFWLVKNSEQKRLQLVLRIYPLQRWIAMPQNGAALWILVEKKTL
jgi:hypothetical protein